MNYKIKTVIKPHSKFSFGLKELWEFRELFYFFTWRDIKIKYKQTALGILWALLQPLLMMVILSLFFGEVLNVPSEGLPYPVFVFSGLMLWNVFSSGLISAGNSMVTNANIIKKIYFPRLVIPISSVLVALFDFAMTFILYIILLIYYQIPVNIIKIGLFLPFSLFITVFATFGPGCLLAALNIKYRDFRYVIPFFIQALLFITPVIYPVSILKQEWLQYVVAINPMFGAIELFRGAFINTDVHWNLIIISLISSVLFFFVGLIFFRKTESYFADLA